MFEDKTFENLMREKINYIQDLARQNGVAIDTRTASMIYFAVAANAFEVGQAYIELNEVLNEGFADTQTRDFLIRRARERGIIVEPATFAIRRGEFNIPVSIGSRFSLNRLNYIVISEIEGETNAFQLRCETAGNIGNLESGNLIPIEYIEGLTLARLADVLIPGEDEEETKHLRQRYFTSLNGQAYGGNIQDYIKKTLSLDGVGGVKVYPVWDGGGTVKLVILNSQFQVPSDALIGAVQTAIDPVPNQGTGIGLAPISHVVTVEGVTSKSVDIHLNITFKDKLNWETLQPQIEQAIDDYLLELASEWDSVNWQSDVSATLIVRISQVETRVLNVTGVLDVQNTTLNGVPSNLILAANSIPVRGTVTNG